MNFYEPCPRCGTGCCELDEITNVCAGRCDSEGRHPEEQPPIVAQLDAMTVAKWMKQNDGRRGVSASSRSWWQAREADKVGLGRLIDCMRQLEEQPQAPVEKAAAAEAA